jgi:hemerythrin superfamily protein
MATGKTRKHSTESDAIEMLKDDHRKVEKLFTQFEKADREDVETCAEIVEEACAALKVHAALEEELFYPAARATLDDEEASLLDEALVEHDTAKMLISRIEGLDPSDPMYAASFTVLAEYIKHHVKEEEGEIFPKVKKAKLDVEDLAAEMRARKEALMEEIGVAPAEAAAG